jgi:N-acylglucosamine-6-phosphate 2-epimerase
MLIPSGLIVSCQAQADNPLHGPAHRAAMARAAAPDLDLVSALVTAIRVPVIAEGRYATPGQVRAAFARGAHAVVVGTAITNPREITRRFAAAVTAVRP